MVKELNNMKNKKSNSYKPYDSSNSFVRRVTSRVSQLLPQPSSWLSRFLSRPENTEPVDSQEGDDEEFVQPPSKRMRTVQTSTEFPLYHNSINPLDSRRFEDRREEEVSPIRTCDFPGFLASGPSHSIDLNAPGPSGLIRRPRFLASTPAVAPSTSTVVPEPKVHQVQTKINGDDGSDSDSVSCTSSLPAESGDHPSESLFRSLNKARHSHRTHGDHDNSLFRSKQLKLDLSSSSLSSSRGRVSFETTVFNSPFKGRLCGGLSVNRDDSLESSFYRSNTTFGGASSSNESLLRTRCLHSEVPIVIQPSQPQKASDNLGSSTKKILKALEQFSTPMFDQSRKMYPRDRGMKRKVEVPYKELVIPQMPDLLRIKRRDARHARQLSGISESARPQLPQNSSTPVPVPHAADRPEQSLPAESTSRPFVSQRLTSTAKNIVLKAEASLDRKMELNNEVKESPSLVTGLVLTSLPKFESNLVKSSDTFVPSTDLSSNQYKFSKPINVALDDKSLPSIPHVKKFSRPIDPKVQESDTGKAPLTNCVSSSKADEGKISMVYCAPTNIKLKRKTVFDKKPDISNFEQKSGNALDALNNYVAPTTSELKSGSVMDALKSMKGANSKPVNGAKWECQGCYVSNDESKAKCVACEQPRKNKQVNSDSSKGFGDKFKMSSNQWECSCCCVRNNINDIKCVSCGSTKPQAKGNKLEVSKLSPAMPSVGFGDKFKPPAGSWECASCLVQNKSGESRCVSCSSDKPGAASSVKPLGPPLSNLFKKQEGSWECSVCLVQNKPGETKCVACSADKPGASLSSKPSGPPLSSLFKKQEGSWECGSCLVQNKPGEVKCVACSSDKPGTSSSTKPLGPPLSSLFKKQEGSWECSSCLVQNKAGDTKCVACSSDKPGASSSAKPLGPPLSNLFKKPEGSWECDTCLVRNKSDLTSCAACGTGRPGSNAQSTSSTPQFSFGIPPVSEGEPKFTFGIPDTSSSDTVKSPASIVLPSVPPTQTDVPAFTFGIPSTVEAKPSVSPGSFRNTSFFSNLKSSNPEKKTSEIVKPDISKVPETSAQKPDQNFTFGIPSTKSSGSLFFSVTSASTAATPFESISSTANSNTPANLPIFVNQISSTKSPVTSVEKTSAPDINPIFTFGSSSSSISSLAKSPSDLKPSNSAVTGFGSSASEVKPMITSPVIKVSATTSTTEAEKINSSELTLGVKPTFSFTNYGDAEKKPFLNSNSSESSKLVFSTSSVNSFNTPSTATVQPTFTFASTRFGSSPDNKQKSTAPVNSFGSQPSQQPTGGYSFKPSESNFQFTQKNQETSPFQFTSTSNNHTNSFGNATPAAATNQFQLISTSQLNSSFGNAATPFSTQGSIFGSSAPQPAQTASFLFGASQTNDRPPPAPTFNFNSQTANTGGSSVGNTAVAGGFAFGQAQNSTPVQPPAFDPNVKPVFNFSGGQTPTFSATATAPERKIRRAVRRTTQK